MYSYLSRQFVEPVFTMSSSSSSSLSSLSSSSLRVLFFGGNGWIGMQMVDLLTRAGHAIHYARCRADDTIGVMSELQTIKPDRVVCFVGRTHGPGFGTIDYLEQPGKLVENIQDNLYAPLSLGLLCKEHGIHMTYMGTGCIFEYDDEHPQNVPNSDGFTESSLPNFFGSSYSVVKGFTDRFMHLLEETVLNVRIRMPIVDYHHDRNFITKITRYTNVCSIPNSMTVLPTLLPCLLKLIEQKTSGTINLTNPGVISHNEILSMYRELVDPTCVWYNFTIEEQNKILASRRSNNMLETQTLQTHFPDVPDIHTAVRQALSSGRW